MDFFKVGKIIAYSILLIVEKLNITFTVNRLFHTIPCIITHVTKEHMSEDDIMFTEVPGL